VSSSSTASWEVFNLNKQLRTAIHDAGFENPTEVQQKCIPLISGGQEVIGIAQTGTGKTAAYLIPILLKVNYHQRPGPRALVLCPTKELAVQIEAHAKVLAKYTDLKILALYGGVGPKSQLEHLAQGVDLLVSTPGRFLELYTRQAITTKAIRQLVIDEADRMMDMGFRPQLRKIFEVLPPKRQNLLFSATLPARVEELANDFLTFPIKVEVTPAASTPTQVEQIWYPVPNLKTKINLLEYLLQNPDLKRVLVFTRTKDTANNVLHFLERKHLGPARVIHSNKAQNTRINAMNEFKEGKLRVLVSTDVSARGIDVDQVSHVINFDVPLLYEDYVHRIGRTGRAFRAGIAITFATDADRFHMKKIEELIHGKIRHAKLPAPVPVEETSREEAQQLARELDRQKRLADPDFKGAFHERKR
jgi:ATP-dependent RNA helicase RhlE